MIRPFLAFALLAAPIAAPAQAPRPAPASSPVANPAAVSSAGLVTAADPRAAEAGRQILREGGSAADAAMAMMLALTVVEPQSSGFGGGGYLVHHDAATNSIATIDGRETAPAAARPDRFIGPDGQPMPYVDAWRGGYSVGVPGNIRLMARAHARWGKLPWARLFEPAIRLAEDGFDVTPRLHRSIAATYRLTKWQDDFPAIAALYLVDGQPAPVGTRLRNPAIARTLRTIAAKGPDAFYTGDIASEITRAVAESRHHPAALTAADLAGYRAKDRPALCGAYRAYRVCGMGPSSSGALMQLQILGMLERFDLKALGPDSPVAWHLIFEAMRLAYADRAKYMADADFAAVPVAGLVDPAYLRARSMLISPDRTLGRYEAGSPPGARPRTAAEPNDVAGTTHFVAVDASGDVATMTSTVESAFGSQIVAGGMVLNNELTDFSFAPEQAGAPVANRVEPGKRPLSAMSPTIVYAADGRPMLALGSAGGKRIIMHVLKSLVGVLDWGLPADQAIALPNIYFGNQGVIVEKGTKLESMIPAFARLGQTVVAAEQVSKLTIAERTADGWRGAADPRSEGVALPQ